MNNRNKSRKYRRKRRSITRKKSGRKKSRRKVRRRRFAFDIKTYKPGDIVLLESGSVWHAGIVIEYGIFKKQTGLLVATCLGNGCQQEFFYPITNEKGVKGMTVNIIRYTGEKNKNNHEQIQKSRATVVKRARTLTKNLILPHDYHMLTNKELRRHPHRRIEYNFSGNVCKLVARSCVNPITDLGEPHKDEGLFSKHSLNTRRDLDGKFVCSSFAAYVWAETLYRMDIPYYFNPLACRPGNLRHLPNTGNWEYIKTNDKFIRYSI